MFPFIKAYPGFVKYFSDQDLPGFVLLDQLGVIRFSNRTASLVFRREIHHMKGKKICSFIAHGDRAKFLQYLCHSRDSNHPIMDSFSLVTGREQSRQIKIVLYPVMKNKPSQQAYVKMIILDYFDSGHPFIPTIPGNTSIPPLAASWYQRHDLLTMLSHEIQNPLGAIFNAVEVLKRKGEQDPAIIGWSYKVIKNQAGNLSSMLRRLLDLSRIGMGCLTLTRQPVSVQTLLEKVLKGHSSGRLMVQLPPIWLQIDPERCMQMMDCLLQVAVCLSESCPDIHFEAAIQGDWCVIRIMGFILRTEYGDQLKGHQDGWEMAGDPFDGLKGRLDIALTLARQLARLHGGYININIPDQVPSCHRIFEVWLPVMKIQTSADPEMCLNCTRIPVSS